MQDGFEEEQVWKAEVEVKTDAKAEVAILGRA